MSHPEPIPMSSPDLSAAERQAVAAVLETPHLSMGRAIQAFEAAMAAFTGSRFAIGVNSGTAGLHLCVHAAGINDGDLVITTPFSFVASTNVLLFERAVPVFVDVDPLTGNLDPTAAAAATRDLVAGGTAAQSWLPRRGAPAALRLKALLPVDVFGQPADYDALRPTAAAYGLRIIEDSCEALGASYRGRPAGTLGDYGVFAFYPNKQITTGEGAMIVTDDEEAAHLMLALRNQGRAPGDQWLSHTLMGYNYRLDEMSAALGRAQLSRWDELHAKRQAVADLYAARLAGIPGIELPQRAPTTSEQSWFVYVIRFAPEIDRDAAAAHLTRLGVPCRPYFLPIHLQPYMVEKFGYRPGDFPVTEDLGRRGLALPFSGVMSADQVDRVGTALEQVLHAS
jgi:dTDP-4-amino-4,6-dideoxygalactose transaminase